MSVTRFGEGEKRIETEEWGQKNEFLTPLYGGYFQMPILLSPFSRLLPRSSGATVTLANK